MLVGMCDVAADDDHVRVEQADGGGQDLAQRAPGVGDDADGLRVTRPHQIHHVVGRLCFTSEPPEVARHRPTAGDRRQASGGSAGAAGLGDPSNLGVSDVALG